jgi:hypothetical protein
MQKLKDLKNKFEGKEMIAKIPDLQGFKRKITIHSILMITNNGKEVVNFNYSWQNPKSDGIPITWGITSLAELINNYELIQQI